MKYLKKRRIPYLNSPSKILTALKTVQVRLQPGIYDYWGKVEGSSIWCNAFLKSLFTWDHAGDPHREETWWNYFIPLFQAQGDFHRGCLWRGIFHAGSAPTGTVHLCLQMDLHTLEQGSQQEDSHTSHDGTRLLAVQVENKGLHIDPRVYRGCMCIPKWSGTKPLPF